MKERLQKIISKSGFASRRKADQLIQEGRVNVNGSTVKTGAKADAGHDVIEVDGMLISQPENKVYLLLNKPHGYITSLHDPAGRQTVMNLVSTVPERIFPVGRLDYDTEGLLILTNDGDFAQTLQHPRNEMPRRYMVKVKSIPSKHKIEKLQKGTYVNKKKYCNSKIKIIDITHGKNAWLDVVLMEGRNRQIKIMFGSIGHRVLKIIRTEFGPFHLGDLPSGSFRFLTKKEITVIARIAEEKGLKLTTS